MTATDPDQTDPDQTDPGRTCPARAGGQQDGRRWRDRAACRGSAEPEVFFPTAQAGPVYVAQVARATAVCRRCPVQAACLEFALRALPDGIAGGTTPQQRRELAARRGSGDGQAPVERGGGFDGAWLERNSAGRPRTHQPHRPSRRRHDPARSPGHQVHANTSRPAGFWTTGFWTTGVLEAGLAGAVVADLVADAEDPA